MGGPVDHLHLDQSLGNLLTVGTDILQGCGATASRYAREAFDSGEFRGHGGRDDIIPVFAGSDAPDLAVGDRLSSNPPSADTQDQACKTGIGDHDIRAATDRCQPLLVLVSPGESRRNFFVAHRLEKISGGSAQFQSGAVAQGDPPAHGNGLRVQAHGSCRRRAQAIAGSSTYRRDSAPSKADPGITRRTIFRNEASPWPPAQPSVSPKSRISGKCQRKIP